VSGELFKSCALPENVRTAMQNASSQ